MHEQKPSTETGLIPRIQCDRHPKLPLRVEFRAADFEPTAHLVCPACLQNAEVALFLCGPLLSPSTKPDSNFLRDFVEACKEDSEPEPACENCRFFLRDDTLYGRCRRFPPAYVAGGYSLFPLVSNRAVCGEHFPRKA